MPLSELVEGILAKHGCDVALIHFIQGDMSVVLCRTPDNDVQDEVTQATDYDLWKAFLNVPSEKNGKKARH